MFPRPGPTLCKQQELQSKLVDPTRCPPHLMKHYLMIDAMFLLILLHARSCRLMYTTLPRRERCDLLLDLNEKLLSSCPQTRCLESESKSEQKKRAKKCPKPLCLKWKVDTILLHAATRPSVHSEGKSVVCLVTGSIQFTSVVTKALKRWLATYEKYKTCHHLSAYIYPSFFPFYDVTALSLNVSRVVGRRVSMLYRRGSD